MRRRHCKKKTKKKHDPNSSHIMGKSKKVFREKISGLNSGTSRRLPANSSRKIRNPPETVRSPTKPYSTTKPHSRISGMKKPMSPIRVKKVEHETKFTLRPNCKPKKNKLGPYEGQYKCWGLTPKEKMQIIGTCQSRLTRYLQLKKIAAAAIQSDKIFSVYGTCKSVRNALVERGWVEKLPTQRMNMNNIQSGRMNKHEIRNEFETLLLSHLVERHLPSFIWRTKEHQTDDVIDMKTEYVPMVNKLQIDAAWTTKQGLCATMKRNYWFYIEGEAEVFCPRTYNSGDSSEIDSFKNDFKITACTSLLKWVLSMVADRRPVFVSNGTVSINVILFAVNRCKEYIYRKQNKDIDKTLSNISSGQWNTFMKNYYLIISKAEHFVMDKDKQLHLYLSYAKLLLKEIHKYRPQLSCEGCHNMWIIKPAHCCRGRGIKLASKLEMVNEILCKAKSKYVVQKYIEEPLLIHDTKFDIRQYYLITSTCPLVIWMYKDCYLKFSTQKYNLKNYHESIHLTNNAVQKKYKNCENRHEELPLNNMWDLDKYISYLKNHGNEGVWDSIIYPGMKKAIISIVLGCQDSMVACKNRFELYGCDFLLDKDYRPWLIEINSCPDLNHTTPVTAKICPAVIKDIIKVVVDYAKNPSSATGKFECIYRQPYTLPRYPSVIHADLIVRGYSLPSSYFYKGKYEFNVPLLNVDNQLDITAAMKMMKTVYDKESKFHVYADICEYPELQESGRQSWISTTCLSLTRIKNRSSDIIQVVSSTDTNQRKQDTDESNHDDSLKNSSESTNETPLEIVTLEDCSSEKSWLDLTPLENALLDLSSSTEKLNPLTQHEGKKLCSFSESNSENQNAATQAVFNLLAFLNRKEREEREYYMNQGKHKGR